MKNGTTIKSIYIGVSWNTTAQKWTSTIAINNKTINCGYYLNERDAAKGRDMKIMALKLEKELQIFKKKV